MLEATMAFMGDQFTTTAKSGRNPEPSTGSPGSQSFIFKCADDKLIAIHLSSLEKFWNALIEAVGAPELGQDPRFAARLGRIKNYVALRDETALRFASAPASRWKSCYWQATFVCAAQRFSKRSTIRKFAPSAPYTRSTTDTAVR